MRNLIRVVAILGTVLTVSAPSTADADVCGESVRTEPYVFDWCSDYYVHGWWKYFDMEKKWWNEGLGFHAACDLQKPLARTLNAIAFGMYAGDFSPSNQASSEPIVNWGIAWAGRRIRHLRGSCANDARATTKKVMHNVYLKRPTFVTSLIWRRASTMMHEGRHVDGCDHSRSNSCEFGSSCDHRFTDGCREGDFGLGANGFQVEWLRSLATDGDAWWLTIEHRADAIDFANTLLQKAFNYDDGLRITPDGRWYRASP